MSKKLLKIHSDTSRQFEGSKEIPKGIEWGIKECKFNDPNLVREVSYADVMLQTYDLNSEERWIENGWEEAYTKEAKNNKFLPIKLAPRSFNWLKHHIYGDFDHKTRSLIDPTINADLQQFKGSEEILLFRGLHFNMLDFENLKKFCLFPLNTNSLLEFSSINPSSWTWNYNQAKDFALGNNFSFILACWFKPEDILIDLRYLREYAKLLQITGRDCEDEVLVQPGSYLCHILPYKIQGDHREFLTKENEKSLQKYIKTIEELEQSSKCKKEFYGFNYPLGSVLHGNFETEGFELAYSIKKDKNGYIAGFGVKPFIFRDKNKESRLFELIENIRKHKKLVNSKISEKNKKFHKNFVSYSFEEENLHHFDTLDEALEIILFLFDQLCRVVEQ